MKVKSLQISEKLHKAIKILCANKEYKLKDWVENALKNTLIKENSVPPKL